MWKKRLIFLAAAALLTACSTSGGSGAAGAVEGYYRAMVEKNEETFIGFTCADWEEQALLEYDSFGGVESDLDAFSCTETGQEQGVSLVTCTGKIVASYGNEKMDFPLDERVHRVMNEGGDWRVCGY